jgi:glucose/arabinose dehydrogenase/cytochrome c553
MKNLLLTLAFFSVGINIAQAETGESLYQQNCAACHGKKMEGAIGPNLADAIWVKAQAQRESIMGFVANGSVAAGMPAWKGKLNEQQLGALADYILAPKLGAPGDTAGKSSSDPYPELKNFRLPVGFHISVYADKVENARALAVTESGIVFVGSRTAGKLYAVVDENHDGVADKVITFAEGLNSPIGLTLLNGALYVSEISRVIRFDNIEKNYTKKPQYKVVKDDLPKDKWHGEKVIQAGPDGKLYIPIGSPCNVCDKEDDVYSKIYRMNPDGSNFEIYAKGIRNSVGFAWHPQTKEFWFTDNGRDEMGDNLPSCELNYAPKAGMHFGFPYCHSGVLPDPEFGKLKSCDQFTAPAANLGPHVAPLGLKFYSGTQFPAQYRNQLFIAEHGSWNRTQKSGYRVALITMVNNKVVSDTAFIEGFIYKEETIGRPVDINFLPDGSMLISDDSAGRIYRVSYQ